jgi:hypothetical protein
VIFARRTGSGRHRGRLAGLVATFALELWGTTVPALALMAVAYYLVNAIGCGSVSPDGGKLGGVDLEEHTLEAAGDRCEECGVKLTASELELVLELGGPTLCSIHMTDVVAVTADDGAEED